MVGPLTILLRKIVGLAWSAECQKAFDGVKSALTTAPVLVMPDYDKPFELIADACGFGIGAALLQEGRPIAYLCRKFSPAECNYGVGEQELLAVVDATVAWRCYLEGVNSDMLTVVTDHYPLTYLQSQSVLSRRQTRWSEYLQMFTFEWHYRPGRYNVAGPLRSPGLPLGTEAPVMTPSGIAVSSLFSPGVLAAMLPIAGSESLCQFAAVHCLGPRQQLTFNWRQSTSDSKLACLEHGFCCYKKYHVITRSQVSQPTP